MTKPNNDLTASYVREVLSYDPNTGVFSWISCSNSRINQGDIAGYLRPDGYRGISIHGRKYAEHRLAHLWMTGEWPAEIMDHIDGNRANNAWSNLRTCTDAQNAQNRALVRTNTSGAVGVTWNRNSGKWQASIKKMGKSHYLGMFETAEKASAAYLAAKASLHLFQPTVRATPARNSYRRGCAKGSPKLTPELVMEIFEASGRQIDIAERYGIHQSHVSDIKRGVVWKSVLEGLIA